MNSLFIVLLVIELIGVGACLVVKSHTPISTAQYNKQTVEARDIGNKLFPPDEVLIRKGPPKNE